MGHVDQRVPVRGQAQVQFQRVTGLIEPVARLQLPASGETIGAVGQVQRRDDAVAPHLQPPEAVEGRGCTGVQQVVAFVGQQLQRLVPDTGLGPAQPVGNRADNTADGPGGKQVVHRVVQRPDQRITTA